jgi:hypothetical protein
MHVPPVTTPPGRQFLADVQAELGRVPLVQEKLFHLRETQGLMADLRDTQPGLSKAEALQQAQRQLLAGGDGQGLRVVGLPHR